MALDQHDVFFHHNFYPQFIRDLNNARGLVLLQSPFLSMRRIDFIEPTLKACLRRGVRVCVFAQEPDPRFRDDPTNIERAAVLSKAVEYLTAMGIHVNMRVKKHEKVAIIDEEILWDGSLNPLSHRDTSERSNRWVSRRLVRDAMHAHELYACDKCPDSFLKPDSRNQRLKDIGFTIAARRRLLGFSQKEVALKVGIDASFLCQIEAGKKVSSITTLMDIGELLQLDVAMNPSFIRYRLEKVME